MSVFSPFFVLPVSPSHALSTFAMCCSTTLLSSKQFFIGSGMPISPPCACCPFICGYMSHLYLSLSSTAVSVAAIVWLAGLAGTSGQCLCVVSGTGPLWGRPFPHCAPPWLGRSVRSCGLLECKLSVPLSNPPPPSYMAIYAFVLVLST